jgi:hypothetical protein
MLAPNSSTKTNFSTGSVFCCFANLALSTGSASDARVVFFSRQAERLQSATDRWNADFDSRFFLHQFAILVERRVRRLGHQIGQDHQMIFVLFDLRASAVRQWGDVALSPLSRQFIDEGFINAEKSGDLGHGSDVAIHGVDNSCRRSNE